LGEVGNLLVATLLIGLPVVSTNCPKRFQMILRNEEYGRLMTLGDKGVYVIALLKMLKINKSIMDQLAKMYFTIDSVAQII